MAWLPTADLVDVLQGQAQGLFGGTFGGLDGVQGLQQGHAAGLVGLPALEPAHLGRRTRGKSIQ